MNYSRPTAWVVTLVIISAIAPSVSAQSNDYMEGSHRMLSPGDLKGIDAPSLPPGAKLAVIEGPLNEAVPFTFPRGISSRGRRGAGFMKPAVRRNTCSEEC